MSYDPSADKIARDNQAMNPVVNAQPVPAYAVHHGTTAAPAAQQVAPQFTHAQSVRPQPNRWKDSICDWPNNLFPSCYCVCCCCYGIWLLAQSKLDPLYFILTHALTMDTLCFKKLPRKLDTPLSSAPCGLTVLSGFLVSF